LFPLAASSPSSALRVIADSATSRVLAGLSFKLDNNHAINNLRTLQTLLLLLLPSANC
jgi:hypothetical protein